MYTRFAALFALLSFCSTTRAIELAVPADGDIQAALSAVASSGGGTVTLAAATYTIPDSLLIGSKTLLRGQGRDSTIITITGDFPVLKQAKEGLRNVSIERLKIVGKPTKHCYGILIEAYTDWHEDITLREVDVTEAGMGVHIKRARHVLIENSRIHANGAAGLERYYHNLYIRSCESVRIAGCTLDDSTSGNGLNVSYCKDVVVERTSARDNNFRGMRAAESEGFSVIDCIITGNGGTGLIANQEKGNVTKPLDWRGNVVSENRDGGIRVLDGATGRVSGNVARDNLNFDYRLPDTVKQSGNS